MKRLLSCLLLPLALAACNATGSQQPDSGLSAVLGSQAAAGVTGFTVLGQDGSINAVWSNTGGTSWRAVSPTQEQITTVETQRSDCCIAFATSSFAVADFQTMQFTLTASGVTVPIVDVVRR
ncbi:MAG: hypothetical protein ACFCVH_02285 [Alphaproteobacteria bacterium]